MPSIAASVKGIVWKKAEKDEKLVGSLHLP